MPEKREQAVGYGYIIADETGRCQLHTLRSNRQEAWKALAVTKKMALRMGYKAVPVFVRQLKAAE